MSFGVEVASYAQLREAVAVMKEQGVTFIDSIPPSFYPGIDYTAFALDPDGHCIQLYYYMEQIGWHGRVRPASERRASTANGRKHWNRFPTPMSTRCSKVRWVSRLVTPKTYLGRVRALLPVLRERTARAEQLRRLPDETFADFQEAGLFRALQPKRYGGYELDPATFYQAVMEVGTVCGSSAWILGVIGVHNWHLAIFPPQAQEDVWGEDTSIQLSTSLAPTGTVQRVDGGFRLSGRWSFSSGCDFCQWAVLGGTGAAGRGRPAARRARVSGAAQRL